MTTPWERLPNESPPAWEAFCAYRDQRAERSQEAVAKQLGKSRQLLARWSSTHGWVGRCQAYDSHLDRVKRQETEAETRAMSVRYSRIAALASGKVVERLQSLAPDELRPGDIGPLLRNVFEIESRARGIPDRLVIDANVTHDGQWSELRDRIVAALVEHPDALSAVLAAISGGDR